MFTNNWRSLIGFKVMKLGQYLTLEDFCTCTQTYFKYAQHINPYPQQSETLEALQALCQSILDPIINHFGYESFQLTYGFCSADLKRFLNSKDPLTGIKNGRVDPRRDQHMAYEVNRKGNYYCERLGAASDFKIKGINSDQVVTWIVSQGLPFDSLYYYGSDRPLHISYGFQHKRDIWTFTPTGQPTKKGLEAWLL